MITVQIALKDSGFQSTLIDLRCRLDPLVGPVRQTNFEVRNSRSISMPNRADRKGMVGHAETTTE